METFRCSTFNDTIGTPANFVQENHSYSKKAGTLRGLHFQSPPRAQGKLIRCIRGSILDVAVDARLGSSTYGKHISRNLSAENAKQLWIPKGFLHGFVTLEDETEVVYKCTEYYSKEHDGSVSWCSPSLEIDWGISQPEAHISGKDAEAIYFADFESPFRL